MGYLYEMTKKDNLDYIGIMGIVNSVTKKSRMLNSAALQLTPLCNLKCKMCYARLEPKEISDAGKRIMTFDEWKYYIDCIAEMGAYVLSLTGGECTLHPDFTKIYSYAYDKGLNVSVMTNCTNITDEILKLFVQKPPSSISMTFYGASPETYERLCGNRNAYYKAFENVDKLVDAGLFVVTKFTITKDNISDYEELDKYCRNRNLELKSTTDLINLGKCDSEVLEDNQFDVDKNRDYFSKLFSKISNVSIEESKSKDEEYFWEKYKENCVNPLKNNYTGCSAGKNTLHITWDGRMTPCVSLLNFAEDPRKIGFEKCWKMMNEWMDNLPVLSECLECPFYNRCLLCIASHRNDTGEFGKVSPRLCWKRKHPEEAAEIMKRLEDEGLINKDEQK